MTIRTLQDKTPNIAESAFVDETALVIGDVTIGEDSSIWPMTVVRGDVEKITIGKRTNIQDACVLHVTHDGEYTSGGFPLKIGDGVTAGHRATLHACSIGDYCLIGMSATIMDAAVLGDKLIIGAGSLVPPGKQLEGGYLYVGTPVKQIRKLNEDELKVSVTYSIYFSLTQPMYTNLKELIKDTTIQNLLKGIKYQLDTDYGFSLIFEHYYPYDKMPDINSQDLINFDAIKKHINMVKKELNKLVMCNRMKVKMKI